jgi:hypothetical protein
VSQVTVCPVVGVVVGVQAARAGSAAKAKAAAASAHKETVLRKDGRKGDDALKMTPGANRFDEDVARIIDISRWRRAGH